jgi:hypothetical protein
MGTTYKLRLEDMAEAVDALDADQAAALAALVDEDTEWLDLDKAGRHLEELATALGAGDHPFLDGIDAAQAQRLATKLKRLTWAQALEHLDLDEDDAAYVEPYYDQFVALVLIAAQVKQGLTAEVG